VFSILQGSAETLIRYSADSKCTAPKLPRATAKLFSTDARHCDEFNV